MMEYNELLEKLLASGYTRIERDDRLLDIMPSEDREKGVELWEKDTKDTVLLLRVRLPYSVKKLRLYEILRKELEEALLHDDMLSLEEIIPISEGEEIITGIEVVNLL